MEPTLDITGLSEKELLLLAVITNTTEYSLEKQLAEMKEEFPEFQQVSLKEVYEYTYELFDVVTDELKLEFD